MADIVIKPSPNGEVALVVSFDVKPEAIAEFESVFARSVELSRKEPGNVFFNIHKVQDTDNQYVLYEVWRDTTALDSHFAEPYTKDLFAMFDRNLTKPITEGGLRFVADLHPEPRIAKTANA